MIIELQRRVLPWRGPLADPGQVPDCTVTVQARGSRSALAAHMHVHACVASGTTWSLKWKSPKDYKLGHKLQKPKDIVVEQLDTCFFFDLFLW